MGRPRPCLSCIAQAAPGWRRLSGLYRFIQAQSGSIQFIPALSLSVTRSRPPASHGVVTAILLPHTYTFCNSWSSSCLRTTVSVSRRHPPASQTHSRSSPRLRLHSHHQLYQVWSGSILFILVHYSKKKRKPSPIRFRPVQTGFFRFRLSPVWFCDVCSGSNLSVPLESGSARPRSPGRPTDSPASPDVAGDVPH